MQAQPEIVVRVVDDLERQQASYCSRRTVAVRPRAESRWPLPSADLPECSLGMYPNLQDLAGQAHVPSFGYGRASCLGNKTVDRRNSAQNVQTFRDAFVSFSNWRQIETCRFKERNLARNCTFFSGRGTFGRPDHGSGNTTKLRTRDRNSSSAAPGSPSVHDANDTGLHRVQQSNLATSK